MRSPPEPDVVMLPKPPLLMIHNGKVMPVWQRPLAGVKGTTASPSVLLPNTQFATNPDVNNAQYARWQLVANALPADTTGTIGSTSYSTVLNVEAGGFANFEFSSSPPGVPRRPVSSGPGRAAW